MLDWTDLNSRSSEIASVLESQGMSGPTFTCDLHSWGGGAYADSPVMTLCFTVLLTLLFPGPLTPWSLALPVRGAVGSLSDCQV